MSLVFHLLYGCAKHRILVVVVVARSMTFQL